MFADRVCAYCLDKGLSAISVRMVQVRYIDGLILHSMVPKDVFEAYFYFIPLSKTVI